MRRTGTGRYRFGATGISFKWPVASDGLGKRVLTLPERQDGQDRALQVRLATAAAALRGAGVRRARRRGRARAAADRARLRERGARPARRRVLRGRRGDAQRRPTSGSAAVREGRVGRRAAGVRERDPARPRQPALAARSSPAACSRSASPPSRRASRCGWRRQLQRRRDRRGAGPGEPGVERARQPRPADRQHEPVRPRRGGQGAARARGDRLGPRLHGRVPRLRRRAHRGRHHLQPGRVSRTPRSSPARPPSRARPTRASCSSATSPTRASTARSTAPRPCPAGRRSRSPASPPGAHTLTVAMRDRFGTPDATPGDVELDGRPQPAAGRARAGRARRATRDGVAGRARQLPGGGATRRRPTRTPTASATPARPRRRARRRRSPASASIVEVLSGEVFIKLPGLAPARCRRRSRASCRLKGVAALPVGTIVDTRKGRLAMQSTVDGRRIGARRQPPVGDALGRHLPDPPAEGARRPRARRSRPT